MTYDDDNLRRLRDADPSPTRPAYPDDEIAHRAATIRDQVDQHPIDTGLRRTAGDRRRLWASAIAASVVVALAAVAAAVLLGRSDGGAPSAAPGDRPVTCAVSAAGGRHATSMRLHRARAAIETRVERLGGRIDDVVVDISDASIGFAPKGVSAARAATACRPTTVAFAAPVVHPVAVDTAGRRSPHPLASLNFPLPRTETQYQRLAAPQQASLTTAMSHYDCSGATETLACASAGDSGPARSVYLLARPLAVNDDVTNAESMAPGSAGDDSQWAITLRFGPAAAHRLTAFTQRYHADSRAAATSCGSTGDVPCSDFLVLTVDRSARLTPLTQAVLSTDITLTGGLHRNTARALAADITAAAVGLRNG